jgi:hypothetical protein
MTNDAYWDWVADLPPELSSEEEYRRVAAIETCEEIIEYNNCRGCQFKRSCEIRKRVKGRRR